MTASALAPRDFQGRPELMTKQTPNALTIRNTKLPVGLRSLCLRKWTAFGPASLRLISAQQRIANAIGRHNKSVSESRARRED